MLKFVPLWIRTLSVVENDFQREILAKEKGSCWFFERPKDYKIRFLSARQRPLEFFPQELTRGKTILVCATFRFSKTITFTTVIYHISIADPKVSCNSSKIHRFRCPRIWIGDVVRQVPSFYETSCPRVKSWCIHSFRMIPR